MTLLHCVALLGWTENPAQNPGQFTKKTEAQKAQKGEDRAISTCHTSTRGGQEHDKLKVLTFKLKSKVPIIVKWNFLVCLGGELKIPKRHFEIN